MAAEVNPVVGAGREVGELEGRWRESSAAKAGRILPFYGTTEVVPFPVWEREDLGPTEVVTLLVGEVTFPADRGCVRGGSWLGEEE